MEIRCFNLGYMGTNCFLAWSEDKNAYLFDCGGKNLEALFDFVSRNALNMKYLILTHGHGNHIEGVNKFIEHYPEVEVIIGEEEKDFLYDSNLSLSAQIFGENFKFAGTYKTVKEGDMVGEFKVIDTPGHTKGSKCFYYEAGNILMAGDTMFKNSFGRYDLPTGNVDELFDSLQKLVKLPQETLVYNAHTETTTIGDEKLFLKRLGIVY